MGSSRQEYWSGLPFPSPGDPPDPGIEPVSFYLLHWQVDSLPQAPPGKLTYVCVCVYINNWITLLSHLKLTHCKSTIIQFLKFLVYKEEEELHRSAF